MGTTQVKLLKAPPQSFVLQSAHFRKTSFPHCRYRGTSPTTLFSAVKELAEKEGVIEQLKATDMMLWVQKVNNIRERVTEVVNCELIFV